MENEVKNELVTVDDGGVKGQLVSVSNMYSSFDPTTIEQKKLLFKAMNNPDKRLSDMINRTINIKDLFVENVTIVDQNSGELITAPRMVFIDDKGISYQCVSKGVFGATKKLIQLFGEPTWKTPLKVSIKQKTVRSGFTILSLELE